VDPKTGIKVIQLTGYPAPSGHLLYDWPFITPDNQRVVLFSQRAAARGAPWDLFRVDADGLNLFQLTDRDYPTMSGGYYGRPATRLALDGTTVYGVWGQTLCAVDVETGRTEELCSLEKHCPPGVGIGNLHLSADGRRLFTSLGGPHAETVIRVDLQTGAAAAFPVDGHLFACDPTGPRLVVSKGAFEWSTATREDGSRVITAVGGLRDKWIADEEGKDIEYFCPEMYAHATLLGKRLVLQGCGKPRKLAQGLHFWHSGASWDGEWIVSDTNWPDQGLQLIHVATGHFATLCHPGASQDHYEFGHPHPALSQDGSMCVFRSDRTGIPQLYIAHITPEFKERVVAGDVRGNDKWMP